MKYTILILFIFINGYSNAQVNDFNNWVYNYNSVSQAKIHLEKGIDATKDHIKTFLGLKRLAEKTLGKKHVNYALICNELGICYQSLGDFQKAENEYLQALNAVKEAEGTDNFWYLYIAHKYLTFQRDLDIANDDHLVEELNTIAEKIYKERAYEKAMRGTPDTAIIAYTQIKHLYANKLLQANQLKKAEETIFEVIELIEKSFGVNYLQYPAYVMFLSKIYIKREKYDHAEAILRKHKDLYAKDKGYTYTVFAHSLANLLTTHFKKHKEADALYQESQEWEKKTSGESTLSYYNTVLNRALTHWNMKQMATAKNFFSEIEQLNQNLVKNILSFTIEEGQESFMAENKNNIAILYSFYYLNQPQNNGSNVYTTSLNYRNLITSYNQLFRQSLFKFSDTITVIKYKEWLATKEKLSRYTINTSDSIKQQIPKLQKKANDLEKELSHLSASFRKQQQDQKINYKKIQSLLKPDEAAIEFVEFQLYNGDHWTDSIMYMAVLLRKSNPQPEIISLFERKQLDSILNSGSNLQTLVNNIYTRGAGVVKKIDATSLYDLVWRPIEKKLGSIKKVFYAPSGLLHNVSFAALPIDSNRYLSEKYHLVQLNTTASLANNVTNSVNSGDSILLYGGIFYDEENKVVKNNTSDKVDHQSPSNFYYTGLRGEAYTWKYLPGTEKEINEIRKLAIQNKYPVAIFKENEATEKSFKYIATNTSPAVIHIATHGFFFPELKNVELTNKDVSTAIAIKKTANPLFRAGLLMAGSNNAWVGKKTDEAEDGILTAYEVSNLYLPNTKLVVLSACETALGDVKGSEGVYGLQRSFKMAGAQNLLMSLWKVPDEETAEFMMEFYKVLLQNKKIEEAFNKAQNFIRTKYKNEPFKWAAWVLVR